jgi:arginyl-tRNA synthetase
VGRKPREIAEVLADQLRLDTELFCDVDVAGPGFLNLRIQPKRIAGVLYTVLEKGRQFASEPEHSAGIALNVEFVSVNPNGPITVGSGRGAAVGSTLCNVLEAAGHPVHREYYINDGVNSEQMRLFAESVRAHALGLPLPENGYKGDYVSAVASALKEEGDVSDWQQASQAVMLANQRKDLEAFGVTFDTWFSEQALHDSGKVEACLQRLLEKEHVDDRPIRTKVKFGRGGTLDEVTIEPQIGAVDDEGSSSDETTGGFSTMWLRSTKFGDDMDRVVRRNDGRLTYIASDVAYHDDKFQRGDREGSRRADQLITVLGPDHHGYIGRLTAVVAALLDIPADTSAEVDELEAEEALVYRSAQEKAACQTALRLAKQRLEVLIFQIVRFVKDGKPAPMRKRDGNIYALIDLIDEIGKNAMPDSDPSEQRRIGRDVARFFYLMRNHDTHLDFDIDLATRQTDENPVFYVQYAHARICGILRTAEAEGFRLDDEFRIDLLQHERELALIKKIADLPFEIQRAAKDYGVHRLATYAQDLARMFHHFYDACRVVQPQDPELTKARLALLLATQIALQVVLCDLLGISAPDRLESRVSAQAAVE